ncbi:MAG: TRAP transporter substrate-binding protein [Nisaea sp.]|jgi:TRAP-type mannitol/chloroaromatic compound transport system substrate-binding protein|uniref:TRAP transporter substrate-binding protein n=1 Tax=Nisaea sp. TaxID=2024842 RepID=UPI001B219E44|nr:TRAP transporter substrate-binding protein [Nisaea sp.]MBO6562705.1 TRAP transporter substrate-binding protein [Nisaea sp.]
MKKGFVALGAALLVAMTGMAEAKTLKVQASSAAGDWAHRFMTEDWANRLAVMSGGDLKIEVLPTKAVVPHRETIDAVANGILDGDLNAVSYFTGRDPAFAMIGDLIAGYDTAEQVQTFCMHGGGKEILQKLYDKYTNGKIHVIGCGPYTKEALVAKKPIRGVDDLAGVKIRSPEGLASEVFRRAGASPVSLPFSEVYTALDKGIVDAADASAYVNNTASGMHKIAKYPIYPGIHSMAVLQFVVNKDVWNKLSDAQRMMLDTWYVAAYSTMRREADLQDHDLVAKDKAGGDITVVDWPQADRDKFRKIAVEAWKDYGKKSPLAQEALDTHIAYMKRIGLLD